MRDSRADSGIVPSYGKWWARPDEGKPVPNTPISTLVWSYPASHENAKRGQSNAAFCPIINRCTAADHLVYIMAIITHWAGPEFIYPDIYHPSNNVGTPVPIPLPKKFLISKIRKNNLTIRTNQIVKVYD